ncbi:hypothetical protein H8S23_05050 [Anaerofilum sp. BX8]|uniref:Uncharacterized protein n=1 Tax=Anaerofilum hominis TaxID=2763016 RepID=A0A923I6R8_9FIRM|nr:hypothetical protein [Anaerofilum hominis]MBC5580864.1 hypothetical protein [Anaerofilum hominis]
MIGLGLAAIKDGLAFSGAPDAEKVCCGFVRIPHLDLLLQIEKPPLLCGGLFWRRRRDFLALHFVALGRAAQQSAGLLLARSRFACGSRSGCGFVRIPHLDLLLQIEKPPLLCGGLFWRRRRDFLALHFVALGRAAQQSAGLLLARSRFACGSRSGCGFVRIPHLDLLLQIEKPPLLCGGLFWRRRRDFLALHFVALGRRARQSTGLPL